MEPGSVREVADRLKLWSQRGDSGLARVEFASTQALRNVVDHLKRSAAVSEFELPSTGHANEIVASLLSRLRSLPPRSLISITGLEGSPLDEGLRGDLLLAFSFQRESLAAIPTFQIWWVPSHLIARFMLTVPDLDSWFTLRLSLMEIISEPALSPFERTGTRIISVAEARALALRFWERYPKAQSEGVPALRIWTELAQPAIQALRSVGLRSEADRIAARMPEARAALEAKLRDIQLLGIEGPVFDLTAQLAGLLKHQGDLTAALHLEEQVVAASTRVHGKAHPSTLSAIEELGVTLFDQGDLNRARDLLEQVLAIRTEILGEDHPNTLAALNNLAAILHSQGDLVSARQTQERVYHTARVLFPDDHPLVLNAMDNLASTIWAQGDHPAARRLQELVVERRTRVLGPDHPDTLTARNNLALTLFELGNLPEARQILEDVVAASKRVLGDAHPTTLEAMRNLAAVSSRTRT